MQAQAAIVGAAYSTIARRADVEVGVLAVEAILGALTDAGLTVADVDGLSVYPSASRLGAGTVDGVDFVGAGYVARALQLTELRWTAQVTPGSFTGAIVEAANAVAAGVCNTVVVWRAMHNPRVQFGRYDSDEAVGAEQFRAPYGLANVVMDFALPFSRYLHQYGARPEHMATYLVRNRENAQRNPDAIFRGTSLTRQAYLSGRMIAEPLTMLDCDMPVDGCGAVVVTRADRAGHGPHRPAFLRGYSSLGMDLRHHPVMTLESMQDSARHAAHALWQSCGMRPTDVDHAQLYDGFSYFVYIWLEAFGFCKPGEAYRFLQGEETSLGGSLPLNTSGGMLGMGRLHGAPQVIEAVRQIQNRCGPRQVAADAVLANAGNPLRANAALLLTVDH
ncbi:hypothetical protein P3H15_41510 [Rhodococcus sp. T2V]|uniref:thiolase C-terminal domain-containing protein n=1 Tax=Rhodococcus sp. T2V TaxID=3034164 RepID=UPI0023E199D0|nr:hypothetical protein [Rhodococcus sp. T2V]MDF3311467.1 hypothetical protein [Rhodococcus sp. T2V]